MRREDLRRRRIKRAAGARLNNERRQHVEKEQERTETRVGRGQRRKSAKSVGKLGKLEAGFKKGENKQKRYKKDNRTETRVKSL